MVISVAWMWLITGAVMAALEMFAISGVGFLFAGLGAISVGFLLQLGYLDPAHFPQQIFAFFAFTAGWAAFLWKPLQRILKRKPGHAEYNDMVGQTAIVAGQPLRKGSDGQASWSGTLMSARLDSGVHAAEVAVGEKVTIIRVEGTTLIVVPKS